MVEYFRPDVKVGALILTALTLLLAVAFLTGGLNTWFTPTQEYTVLLPNANLLRRRAKVSYTGSPVGEVKTIGVHNNTAWQQDYPGYPVAVTITVRDTMPLSTDTRVELRTDGFIGERYLDIVPGMGPPLAPGGAMIGVLGGVDGLVASFTGAGGLGELKNALRGLLDTRGEVASVPMALGSLRQLLEELRPRLLDLTGTLHSFLTSTQQQVTVTGEKAGHTLTRLEETLTRLDTAVSDNSVALQRLLREAHASLGEVNKTLATAQKTLSTATTVLNTTQGDARQLLTSLRTLSGQMQRSLTEALASVQRLVAHVDTVVAQNDRNLYLSVEALRETAEQFKAIARHVRANPSVLIWGPRGPQDPDTLSGSDATTKVLQDRGRVGRYDKLQ